jgi:hypothetical protein
MSLDAMPGGTAQRRVFEVIKAAVIKVSEAGSARSGDARESSSPG